MTPGHAEVLMNPNVLMEPNIPPKKSKKRKRVVGGHGFSECVLGLLNLRLKVSSTIGMTACQVCFADHASRIQSALARFGLILRRLAL